MRRTRRRPELRAAAFVAAGALALSACASDDGVRTIALVAPLPGGANQLEAMVDALADHGWVEGENLQVLDEGVVASAEEQAAWVSELAEARPDVIVTFALGPARAVESNATTTELPHVFLALVNPVDLGFVADLDEPGSNVTGVMGSAVQPKALETLVEITGATTVLTTAVETDPGSLSSSASAVEAGAALDVEVVAVVAATADALPTELSMALEEHPDAGGLLLNGSVSGVGSADIVGTWAVANGVPIATTAGLLEGRTGIVVTHADDLAARAAAGADLVARLLEGADPATTPVARPTPVLVVDLVQAAAIGLDVPADVLLAADRVLEE